MTRTLTLAALALACLAAPAFALADVAAPDTTVIVPWGTYLTDALTAVAAVAVPVVSAFLVQALRQVAPWAALFLSQQRIEAMVRSVTDYGLNAIDGAAKGRALSVPVGSAVIAKAVQRAVDAAPRRVVEAAGGPAGIAERVFRTLHLEDGATAANVLAPAIAALRGGRT